MARQKGSMFIILGLMLAIGAGALVFFAVRQQGAVAAEESRRQALQEFAPKPTVQVPVAARPLEPGQVISAADYIVKDYPVDLVPVTAISDTKQLDNQVLVTGVGQGDTFKANQLLGGEGTGLAEQIDAGNMLVAFPIVDLLGQSNLLREGDHIDLFLSIPVQSTTINGEEQSDLKATALTLQNIQVFKVVRAKDKDGNEGGEPTALLFSLKPEDAVTVKFVKDSGGTIDFALRSPIDNQVYNVPALDDPGLLSRYFQR